MIAVVRQSATEEQLDHLIRWIHGQGFKTHVSHGDNETIVGIIGDTSQMDPFLLESMSIIRNVQRVSEPFKKASRSFHPSNTVVDCGHNVLVGDGGFTVVASIDTMDDATLMDACVRAKEAGATMLRGRAYVPRTSPYSFQGMGERGLDLLAQVGTELDLPVIAEVLDPRDVPLFVRKGIDVIQVGARNAQNPCLLREVGKTATPVLLKRGFAGTIDELLMAAEYVMSEGNPNVMLCESGIRTFETRMQRTFDVNAIPVLKHLSHLPVLAEPTHSASYTRYAPPLAFSATAAGADGVQLEVHAGRAENPSADERALSTVQLASTVRGMQGIRAALVAQAGKE